MDGLFLPSAGLYCVAIAAERGFRHRFFTTPQEAYDFALLQDARGETVYVAQGSFRTNENRKGENVLAMRAFFLDIDCGDKWPLKDQREGITLLKRFVAESNLPMPAVTSSGFGLYAHWPLMEDAQPGQWRRLALYMKDVVRAYAPALMADATRAADLSSVLRPVGSHNRKRGEGRIVSLLKGASPVSLDAFAKALVAAGARKGVKVQRAPKPRPTTDTNSEFLLPEEMIDPRLISNKCAQIRHVRDTSGDVPEPLWYASIGLLRHATEGSRFIHEWSKGHATYSVSETDNKIAHHQESGVGPTTCVVFHQHNPSGCDGCRYAGKIKSPIVLGRMEPEPLPEVTLPSADNEENLVIPTPEGFTRSKNGVYCEVDGVQRLVYRYDFYPVDVSRDHSLGYEVVTWRHWLPHEGWREFRMRSAMLADQRQFSMELMDNHVHISGAKERVLMMAYASSFLERMREHRKMSALYTQMGWHTEEDITEAGVTERPVFVLGDRLVDWDGNVRPIGLAANMPDVAQHFTAKGDLREWVEAPRIFNAPGMEAQAFGFLAAAFGSPLMRFSGFAGSMVSMVGKTGAGKTLTSLIALSVYGSAKDLLLVWRDTANSLMNRLGTYNTLPLVIDELTNLDPEELSNLAYSITQGRDKLRMTRQAKEQKKTHKWNTIGLVTTNQPVYDKLLVAKADATPEISRVFEFSVEQHPDFNMQTGARIEDILSHNYGLAGEKFIQYLVRNYSSHRENILKLVTKLNTDICATGDERYWVSTVAVSIYGGMIAKRLGLIDLDVARIYEWAKGTILSNRNIRADSAPSVSGTLGQFIDSHASNRLIIKSSGRSRNTRHIQVMMAPHGPLHMMQDVGEGAVNPNYLYISKPVLRAWLIKRRIDLRRFTQECKSAGVLIDDNARKTLGAGTDFAGAQQACWIVNVEDLELPRLQLVPDGKGGFEMGGVRGGNAGG